MTAYVGVDLHRRRSLAVCINGEGERLWWRRFENSPLAVAEVVGEAGPDPEVVLEATWGWYWAADVITEVGGRVHLAHPLGIKGFENRRVKNDLADATMLADLLRMGRVAGVVDSAPIDPGIAGAGPLPAQVVPARHRTEGPGACGVGQGGGDPTPDRDVGTGRPSVPRRDLDE